MSNPSLEHCVTHFLKAHCDPALPVLLGLSGGPDSLALLYLLLPHVKRDQLRLHVAHVDHGWRPESSDEAEQLAKLSKRLGLPFHYERLPPIHHGNLEASGREARLKFFATLCDRYDCQAVLLGHQADDIVETTLKRVLEGVTLPYLNGLQPVVTIDRLVIWRPLLSINKRQIFDWLHNQNLVPFEDATNRDPRFLRSRMRTELLPALTQQFGKDVYPGLRRIADDAQDLRQYLDGRIEPWLSRLIVGPMGNLLSLEHDFPDSSYELRYLVRRVVERAGMFVSREILDDLVQALVDNTADKRAAMGSQTIIVDRRRLFMPSRRLILPEDTMALRVGAVQWGPWEIVIEPLSESNQPATASGWQQAWQGETSIYLPLGGEYRVGRPLPSARLVAGSGETTLSRWWSNHKVPAFLRDQIPVIWEGQSACAEFLTEHGQGYAPETAKLRLSCRLMSNPPYATIP